MRVYAINCYTHQNNYKNKTRTQHSPANVHFGVSAKYQPIYNRMVVEINNMLYGHRPFGFHSPEGYCEVLKNFDIADLISIHGESAVFTMKNPNHILKISCAPYEEYIPEFHAPEIARGVITTSKSYPIINLLKKISTNKFYWVKQIKGEMPVTAKDQTDLIKRAENAGYEIHDIKHDQFAYFNGEARFIDLGCVMKKGQEDNFWEHLMFKN